MGEKGRGMLDYVMIASVAECDIPQNATFKHLNYLKGKGSGEGPRANLDCPF